MAQNPLAPAWNNLAHLPRAVAYSVGLARPGRLEPDGAGLLAGLAEGTTITISPTT